MAAVNGIDLDAAEKKSNQERLEDINQRALAKITGKTEDQINFESVQNFGFEIEIEE